MAHFSRELGRHALTPRERVAVTLTSRGSDGLTAGERVQSALRHRRNQGRSMSAEDAAALSAWLDSKRDR